MTCCVTCAVRLLYFSNYDLSTRLGLHHMSTKCDYNSISARPPPTPPSSPGQATDACAFHPSFYAPSPFCCPFFSPGSLVPPCLLSLPLQLLAIFTLYGSFMMALCFLPLGSLVSMCPLPESPPNTHEPQHIYLIFSCITSLSMANCFHTW